MNIRRMNAYSITGGRREDPYKGERTETDERHDYYERKHHTPEDDELMETLYKKRVSKKEHHKRTVAEISAVGEVKDAIMNSKTNRLEATLANKPDFSGKIKEIVSASKQFTRACAKKVTKFMIKHYPGIYPLALTDPHNFLITIKKYFAKKDFSKLEMELFMKLLKSSGQFEILAMLNSSRSSPLAIFLGEDAQDKAIKLENKDKIHFNTLYKLFLENKSLNRDVVVQSSTYKDCSPETLYGNVKDEQRSNKWISPVIFALYTNKINRLEQISLHADYGRIVCERSILVDKMETRCSVQESVADDALAFYVSDDPVAEEYSKDSPIVSVIKRYMMQMAIKRNVLLLRRGFYFTFKPDEPDHPICVLERYADDLKDATIDFSLDTPDDQKLLKKVFASCSYRPTILALSDTIPDYSMYASFAPRVTTTSASVATIDLVLPSTGFGNRKIKTISDDGFQNLRTGRIYEDMFVDKTVNSIALNLEDVLKKDIYMFSNGIWMQRTKAICYTDSSICFCIDRKSRNTPLYNVASNILPSLHIMPFPVDEMINRTQVKFDEYLTIGGVRYDINSAVTLETSTDIPDSYCHTSAIVFFPDEHPDAKVNTVYYNPSVAARKIIDREAGVYYSVHPVSLLPFASRADEASVYPFIYTNSYILIFTDRRKKNYA